jgi:basic membrane protein A
VTVTHPKIRRAAFAACAVVLSAACRDAAHSSATGGKGPRVGVVLSTGGRGDKGFNDAAVAGAGRAAAALGADTAVADVQREDATLPGITRFAEEGRDLVVGVSFMASQPTFQVAKDHPAGKFAVLDYAPVTDEQGRALPLPPNMAGITYRAEEGAYLAGALAGLKTATRKVGFVGGMYSPIVREFEAGYTAGVRAVCSDCVVLVDYAGTSPAAFNQPERGLALALAQYGAGADVIFHASGGTGKGVFQAAQQANRWVIGVDVDQSAEAPGRVLTSVTKKLDVSLYGLVEQVRSGRFHGGLLSQGLSDGAVGYVYDARNRPLIPDSVYFRVETLRQAIVAGLVKVPKVPADARMSRR